MNSNFRIRHSRQTNIFLLIPRLYDQFFNHGSEFVNKKSSDSNRNGCDGSSCKLFPLSHCNVIYSVCGALSIFLFLYLFMHHPFHRSHLYFHSIHWQLKWYAINFNANKGIMDKIHVTVIIETKRVLFFLFSVPFFGCLKNKHVKCRL